MNRHRNGLEIPPFDLHEEVYVESKDGCALLHPSIVRTKGNEFFILGHPPSDPLFDRIKLNDLVRVHCFRDRPFRFNTQVLHLAREPKPLLFLRYPQFIEHIDQRDGERKRVFIQSELTSLPGDLSQFLIKGFLLDVSETGCQMWGDFLHLLESEVVLTFRVPWTGDNIRTEVSVVRYGLTDMGLCGGLKFINMDTAIRNHVREFIGNLAEDRIARLLRKYLPAVNANDLIRGKQIRAA